MWGAIDPARHQVHKSDIAWSCLMQDSDVLSLSSDEAWWRDRAWKPNKMVFEVKVVSRRKLHTDKKANTVVVPPQEIGFSLILFYYFYDVSRVASWFGHWRYSILSDNIHIMISAINQILWNLWDMVWPRRPSTLSSKWQPSSSNQESSVHKRGLLGGLNYRL